MKRNTIILLGVFVVLLGLYFLTGEEPTRKVDSPMTIPKVEGLKRIELKRSAGTGGKAGESEKKQGGEKSGAESGGETEIVALEKRDGEWWLTQPVEAPAAEQVATDIDELFGSEIATDDVSFKTEEPAKYKVGAKGGVTLKLYGGDGGEPAAQVVVGKQFSVDGTGKDRTYLRKPDGDKVYRAQAALGDFVRKSVDDMRSSTILDLKSDAVSRLEIDHADGTKIVLEKQAVDGGNAEAGKKGESGKSSKKGKESTTKEWTLVEPTVDWELDTGAVGQVVSTLSRLEADGFADDKAPAKVGLDAPAATLTVGTGDATHTLALGKVEADGETTWYAKRGDQPFQYKLSTYAGKNLHATLGDIRSKTPREIETASITEVRFAGEAGVRVERKPGGNEWTLAAPNLDSSDDGKSPNSSKIQSLVDTVASLRVEGFPEISKAEAGLTGAAERVVIETKDGRVTLLVGDKLEGDQSDDGRYVAFADGEEVYEVSSSTVGDLMPTVDDVTGKSGPPGMGGMKGMKGMPGKGGPPGMGGGMGGKRKLSPQMMQKLKQQLGK